MSEPRRWLDDATVEPQLKELLAAEAGTELPDAVRERVAAKLGMSLGIAGFAAVSSIAVKAAASTIEGTAALTGSAASSITAGGSAGSLTAVGVAGGTSVAVGASGVVLKSIVVASMFGVAVGTSVLVAVSTNDVPASNSARAAPAPTVPSPSVAPPSVLHPSGPERAETKETNAVETPAASIEPTTARAPSPSSSAVLPRSTSGAQTPDFAVEVSSLRAVNALVATDSATALRQLDEHARRYPRSQLSAERELLKLRTLLALGRRAEARSLAKRLLNSGEARLYHDRVKRLLNEKEPVP